MNSSLNVLNNLGNPSLNFDSNTYNEDDLKALKYFIIIKFWSKKGQLFLIKMLNSKQIYKL